MGDRLRDDAADLIDQLRDAGVRQVAMVTGDDDAPGREVARQAGIDRVRVEPPPPRRPWLAVGV